MLFYPCIENRATGRINVRVGKTPMEFEAAEDFLKRHYPGKWLRLEAIPQPVTHPLFQGSGMLNSLDLYYAAGRSAAQALNEGDHARFQHWAGWKRRAVRLETSADALDAERAYDDGYRAARRVPRPEHFR